MANATSNIQQQPQGPAGIRFLLGVDGGTHIYEGTFISQLTATGMAVPTSTASSGPCVGVSQHEADASAVGDGVQQVYVETRRLYRASNGSSTDAFSSASLIGSVCYAFDDHTVYDNSASNTLKAVGFFMGMEEDGKVLVFVDPIAAAIVDALKRLTDTPASADALRDNIVNIFG